MSQGVGGGIWISLNCNHCCCQQSWHSSGWKILHSGRKRLRHERNTQKKLSFSILHHWNSNYCGNCKTQKFQPTAKLLLASPGLTLQMWLCRTSFLVRWLQHFDFVEQFSNTHGILIFILFSLLVKEGLNNKNEIRITFIKRHKFKIKLLSNKFYSRS